MVGTHEVRRVVGAHEMDREKWDTSLPPRLFSENGLMLNTIQHIARRVSDVAVIACRQSWLKSFGSLRSKFWFGDVVLSIPEGCCAGEWSPTGGRYMVEVD